MEGSSSSSRTSRSRAPEIAVAPAPRPAAGGGGIIVDAVKAASKEPISPGSPSAGGASSKAGRREVAVSLPGWKLDSLCKEATSQPAMMGRFPYF